MQKMSVSLRLVSAIGLLCALLSTAGCGGRKSVQMLVGKAQGTSYHVSFWSAQAVDANALQRAVDGELARIDQVMSGYRPDSTIEQFNADRGSAPVAVGAEIVELVARARAVNAATEGCYDPTIKPLFTLWGFQADHFTPPSAAALRETLAAVGMDKLRASGGDSLSKAVPSLRLDLSSIGQGYSVARVAQVLEQFGIGDYLVEIGGELVTRGHKPGGDPWRVAIERPLPQERSVDKVVTIERAQPLAVMTSGTYRHFFDRDGKRYSHILDARSGRPVEHATVSVTVLYPDPTAADAWSTALLCLGSGAGIAVANREGIPALFIDQRGDALQESVSEPLAALNGVVIE